MTKLVETYLMLSKIVPGAIWSNFDYNYNLTEVDKESNRIIYHRVGYSRSSRMITYLNFKKLCLDGDIKFVEFQ